MKKILPLIFSLVPFLLSAEVPAYPVHDTECLHCMEDEESFKDLKSGLCFKIPKDLELLKVKSDLDTEEAERWILFSNDQEDDIALVISQLEGPLTPAELLLQFFLKEFQAPVDLTLRTIFGSPSVKLLTNFGRPVIKVSYAAVQGRFEYLNTDYFFTHGNYGFNLWISPSENDGKALEKLEKQVEKLLEGIRFADCFAQDEHED